MKNLIFLPLGISISSLILYIYNVIYYRINNIPVTEDVRKVLKIYILIAILGFIVFILIKGLMYYLSRRSTNIYSMKKDFNNLEKQISKETIRCKKCNYVIDETDNYCRNCGMDLNRIINKDLIKNIINIIEIVVLIIILYLLVMFIFEYKSKVDSNFKMPKYFRLLK
ncbi:MAG TPA: zinc ribbon domain-containing protein [Bacilli bacterium]|nr:zinc ribbon domain-containing protein [Bacilli bacterium]